MKETGELSEVSFIININAIMREDPHDVITFKVPILFSFCLCLSFSLFLCLSFFVCVSVSVWECECVYVCGGQEIT